MTATLAPATGHLGLVYDGDCGICSAAVRWLRARDEHGAITFTPSYAVTDPRVLAAPTDDTIVVVRPDGAILLRARGVATALAHTRGVWRFIGRVGEVVLVVPPVRWLADLPYRAIAHNRRRLSARLVQWGWIDQACEVRR